MAQSESAVPKPTTLLLIQTFGGVLSLVPIVTLHRFAVVSETLHYTLLAGAGSNVLVSLGLLLGNTRNLGFYARTAGKLKQLDLVRLTIIYDTILLGTLVVLTGGSEDSVFGPQFGAILPVAMLVPDEPVWKWGYAAVFFVMFLIGLFPGPFTYLPSQPEKHVWFLVFFFLFTMFPVTYSIATEGDRGAAS